MQLVRNYEKKNLAQHFHINSISVFRFFKIKMQNTSQMGRYRRCALLNGYTTLKLVQPNVYAAGADTSKKNLYSRIEAVQNFYTLYQTRGTNQSMENLCERLICPCIEFHYIIQYQTN